MRRGVVLPMCFALVQALCLSPFAHVHSGEHAVVHAHFFVVVAPHADSPGPHIDDDDDHGAARSLDTFVLAFAPSFVPFVLPSGQMLEPVSAGIAEPVDPVEACAHGPPALDQSIPRAPPA